MEDDSKTVFNIAVNSLYESRVKDVIILKRFPRFDPRENDPNEIKRELSEHANNYYDKLWKNHGSPKNVHIVSIPLGTEESFHLQRIIHGSSNSLTFDGYSLNGPGASRHLSYRTVQALKPILGN